MATPDTTRTPLTDEEAGLKDLNADYTERYGFHDTEDEYLYKAPKGINREIVEKMRLEQLAYDEESRAAGRAKRGELAVPYVFKVPPFLDAETLKKLQVRVQVLRLGFDGTIEDFRIVSKSNDRSFDDRRHRYPRRGTPQPARGKDQEGQHQPEQDLHQEQRQVWA